jgi:hypothetical protein
MVTDIVLRYVGLGFLPNVPARDLTADDLATLTDADKAAMTVHEAAVKATPKGEDPPDAPVRRDRRWLVKSGLYEPADAPAKKE